MPTREKLHGLVDSLPEKSLEAAERFLTALQTWPPHRPPMPPDIERFRTEYKQRRTERLRPRSNMESLGTAWVAATIPLAGPVVWPHIIGKQIPTLRKRIYIISATLFESPSAFESITVDR
jgi:hypothetical protein